MTEQDSGSKRDGIHRGAIAVSVFAGGAFLAALLINASQSDPGETAPSTDIETVAETPALTTEDLWTAAVATPPRTLSTAEGQLKRRDTLSDLLIRLGASPADAHAALKPLFDADLVDPRRLRPGLTARATFETDDANSNIVHLVGLTLRSEADHSFLVTRASTGDFEATRLDARLYPKAIRVAGTIETSIYQAALADGARDQQVVDFAQVFAYDVDFQREIQPGDRFEIVYETLVDEDGTPIRNGEVIFAALESQALDRAFYRFTAKDDGITDYYDAKGESARKFLMKTPINGARLSSHFGKRRHPISGYTRMHRGTDFAAPTGTPIYAAGHGVVERASRYGGYGHYVRIRHANSYKTAYAHLSRYGRGIRSGVRVRQGQVIGYVGSTGASTGPHLHYEVMVRGKHVNPMRLNLPTGRKLVETPDVMKVFEAHRQEIDRIRRDLGAEVDVAGVSQTRG